MQANPQSQDPQASSPNCGNSLDDKIGGSQTCNVAGAKTIGNFDREAVLKFKPDDAVRDLLFHMELISENDGLTDAGRASIADRVMLWINLAKAQGGARVPDGLHKKSSVCRQRKLGCAKKSRKVASDRSAAVQKVKSIHLYRSSCTDLSHLCHTTYRLVLFGFTLWTWKRSRPSRPEDWGVIG